MNWTEYETKLFRFESKFLLYAINLCILISLTSCNNNLRPPDPPDSITEHSPVDISESLVARIYFDASASMEGFVVPSSTQYKNILRPLESVIESGWRDGKDKFSVLGNRLDLSVEIPTGKQDTKSESKNSKELYGMCLYLDK